ncbi:MAG: IS4 family transposase [Candidatus Omnitrophota bacterium]
MSRYKRNIIKLTETIKEKRSELENNQLQPIKRLITKRRVETICREDGYIYRKRKLTPIITILHMLGAALSREGSFQSSWNNGGQIAGSDALAKARKRLPLSIWDKLDLWIASSIEREFGQEALWRGHRVVGIDGTCVSMGDEKELGKRYGKTGSKHGASRFPIARMVFAFALKTHITIKHQIDGYRVSEKELLRRMLKHLKNNDLIICDRQFAGANLYAEYRQAGLEFITRLHQRLRVERLRKIKEYSKRDFVAELPLLKKHRRENPMLPSSITVRLIEVKARIRGRGTKFWLVTSLLDAKKYPACEIKDLYKKRWEVETLIKEQKIWLGSDVLRSKTSAGICKEIYARIVAGNLIHWLILKASQKHKVDATRISLTTATRLINHYSIRMSEAAQNRLPCLYEDLLAKIAASIIPYRPNRIEPRFKRRDQKHYSILHTSRKQWRRENAFA